MNKNYCKSKNRVNILGLILFFSLLVIPYSNSFAEEKENSSAEILFFYSPRCHHCLKVKNEILPSLLEKIDKEVKVRFLDISEIKNYQLLLELEEKYPLIGKGDRPKIFVDNVILVGEEAIKEKLVEKINSLKPGLKISFPQLKEKPTSLLLERFKSFSYLAIITAGLLDGLNPCAFAVIVFFISFLTVMKYKKNQITAIGLTFVIAVFFTYLLLGLGILKGLQKLSFFYSIAKGVNLGIGIFALILAFLNFKDFYIYKKTGSPKETKLKLSSKTHSFVHRIVNKYFGRDDEGKTTKPLIILTCIAFIVGILIAICTAACTGQVYLPTIVFTLSVPNLRAKALFYLIIYNLMYILPLVIIFGISLAGISSEKLVNFGKKKFGLMKVLLGLLFLVLGIILIGEVK